jgi:hypothetical protein
VVALDGNNGVHVLQGSAGGSWGVGRIGRQLGGSWEACTRLKVRQESGSALGAKSDAEERREPVLGRQWGGVVHHLMSALLAAGPAGLGHGLVGLGTHRHAHATALACSRTQNATV